MSTLVVAVAYAWPRYVHTRHSPLNSKFMTQRCRQKKNRAKHGHCVTPVWTAGGTVRALDLRLKGSRFRISAVTLSGNNLGQVVHTNVPLSPSSIIWYRSRSGDALRPCGWEGNRRSGVALAMRHRFQWFIHLRVHGLRKGDEHPAFTRHGVWHSF